eukprot:7250151-Prymnesium_polylepis.2
MRFDVGHVQEDVIVGLADERRVRIRRERMADPPVQHEHWTPHAALGRADFVGAQHVGLQTHRMIRGQPAAPQHKLDDHPGAARFVHHLHPGAPHEPAPLAVALGDGIAQLRRAAEHAQRDQRH